MSGAIIQFYLPFDDAIDLEEFRKRYGLSASKVCCLIVKDFLSGPNPERIFEKGDIKHDSHS